MAGFDLSKFLDEDWQQAHRIDRPGLTCEIVQVVNAVLVRCDQWIGSDALGAMVVAHTLLCSRCAHKFIATAEQGIGFKSLLELAINVLLTQGEEMQEFLKNRLIMGTGRAVNVSCEEVQASILKSFETGEPPESVDDQAVYIAHILICQTCGAYLHQLSEGRKVEQSNEDGAPE